MNLDRPDAQWRDQSRVLLFVVNVSWFFLSHRLSLALAARDAGFEVHLATHVASKSDRAAIEEAGIIVHDVRIGRSEQGLLHNVNVLLRLWSLYLSLTPDVIHHVTMKPVILGGIAARLARVPSVVAAIPGLGYAFIAEGTWATIRRAMISCGLKIALNHKNSAIIFQNPDDMARFISGGIVDAASCVLIRGAGVDTRVFELSSEPGGRIKVLLAARMLREKGVETFVDAARVLKQRGIEVECQIAGQPDPGNPGSINEGQLLEWNSSGVVRWLGHVKDMAALIREIHIVCLPSFYGEGVPRILIEAAAAGRAVVTSDMPGCREIVHHGYNGLLVRPRDPIALANALVVLIEDADLRRLYGLNGRQLVEGEFSLASVLERTTMLYDSLDSSAQLGSGKAT